jgi:Leucine-rich repeat (LRR) protein
LTLSTLDDSGAAALTFCKHLERLCVKDTKITDDGIESLAKITSLQHLDLSRTGITDNSLPYLAQMPKLVDLALNQTNVTASGVAKLCERSKRLKSLEIIACHKLDRNQIPQLRRQLHNIQIKIKDNP